ncbi:MAG: hypothetical protein DRP50_05115 [Thermotoga sp.]|nr:MAG: hypothetical protein DRP50_05115 [Thermotoga sp.]
MMMYLDEYSFSSLEFDKVVEHIKSYTFSNFGKRALSYLKPMKIPIEEQQRIRDIMDILEYEGGLPIGGIFDFGPFLMKIKEGTPVDGKDFISIANTFISIDRLKRTFAPLIDKYVSLTDIYEDMKTFPEIVTLVFKTFEEDGTVKDSATPELKRIRNSVRRLERKIKRDMNDIVSSARYRNLLQEQILLERDGRYVIPLKSEYRGKIRGIVHSMSSSGSTVYVEPEEVVKMNDDLRLLHVQEKNEIRNIMRNILICFREKMEAMKQTAGALEYFDSLYARASYGIENDCAIPEHNLKGILRLKKARHPLIPSDKVVPIDVRLGDDFDCLIVTGPNTGGKTVSLKTIGLLVLMNQAGIPIPASSESELPFYDNVYADIGDEQSIEQSLSTFSSHMKNIVYALNHANSNTLVLLDEIGAGTDPTEGVSLAMALVEHLLSSGVKVVATTHYGELKLFAYSTKRVENGSVEFDTNTLKPTYNLLIGIPGTSNAFHIASALNMPGDILKRAKEMIKREFKIDNIIEALHRESIRMRKNEKELKFLQEGLKKDKRRLAEKLEKLKKKEYHDILEEYDSIKIRLKKLKKESEDIIRKLKSEREFSTAKQLSKRIHDFYDVELKAIESDIIKLTDEKWERIKEIKVGDTVEIKGIRKKGVVQEIKGKMIKINVRSAVITVSEDMIRAVSREDREVKETEYIPSMSARNVHTEVDVRGKTVEDAIEKVDDFLNALYLSDIHVGTIIHGKGTGKLRKGIWDFLGKHSLVMNFRMGVPHEGGAGVTVVEVK